MVRSMFSGVAGMKAHQTKMDTIGNNISNVNTYGFKSSRVTFRDIYYQNMRSASQGTSNRGGTNPSQIGYGSTVGSIDVNHGQASMQNTGNPLDTAITGDGFFQVQDIDGNTFYTKAGMLDVDSYGNVVDVNGNFVLGVSGNPMGKPAGTSRIQISVPSVNAAKSSYEEKINEIKFKMQSSKQNSDSNVTFTFTAVANLPMGQDVKAFITSSGINVHLNADAKFADMAALEKSVNEAIKAANNGVEHPGGTFSISMDPPTKFTNLKGSEICGSNFGIKPGTVDLPSGSTVAPIAPDWSKIFSIESVGDAYSGGHATTLPAFTIKEEKAATPPVAPLLEDTYTFEMLANGKTYSGKLTLSEMATGRSLMLKSGGTDSSDSITMGCPSFSSMTAALGVDPTKWTASSDVISTSSTASNELGLGGPFKLKGGTAGGPQSVEDLSSIAIGSDGIIIGNHSVHGLLELGRIDIATFANSKGLVQSGKTYFTASANSGAANAAKPGEGGTGSLASGSLEMSNVDLSNEFADMITTQRGFQANSRMITVSDTMLEELINLKR